MPKHSRMVSAILNDPDRVEEIAAAILDQEDDDAEAEEDAAGGDGSLVGQTPEVVVLQDIADILLAALGGKARYPRPEPAAHAAAEALRAERAEADALEIIAALTPWALETGRD